jgi:peptidylprolyl isomerase
MKVGGRRLLVIPSDLGYGETGQGDIAAGETLVFVVDLVGVTPAPEPPPCRSLRVVTERTPRRGPIVVEVTGSADSKPEVSVPDGDPPCELQLVDVREGSGPVAAAGDTLKMQYVGISWSTKEQFDTSWGRSPFEFSLGGGQVIKGWDQGIAGMRAGGRRLLVIPPDLGYGATGAGGAIAPNETLVFVVDLLEIT